MRDVLRRCERESSSFKTAWLNDAHLFAVTRRQSVENRQLIYSTKLTCVCMYVCMPLVLSRIYNEWIEPMLIWRQSSRQAIHISILCNVLRHTAYTIFELWIFYRNERALHVDTLSFDIKGSLLDTKSATTVYYLRYLFQQELMHGSMHQ